MKIFTIIILTLLTTTLFARPAKYDNGTTVHYLTTQSPAVSTSWEEMSADLKAMMVSIAIKQLAIDCRNLVSGIIPSNENSLDVIGLDFVTENGRQKVIASAICETLK